jgi:4-hydroxythreonine-4-phosphate dehydrogenase
MRPIAVSLGEPAGIGPEIIIKAWERRAAERLPPFFVCGDLLLGAPTGVGFTSFTFTNSQAASRALEGRTPPDYALHVVNAPLTTAAQPGIPDPANAAGVIAALDEAIDACIAGDASALVTAPIQKSTLYAAGFSYPGHTEYLAAKFDGPPEPLMLLVGGGLKVALVTIHVPLKDVAALLTTDAIVRKGRILARGLEADFAIAQPRIAVAALNPHGGEAGALGREEIDIIAPAVERLVREGINARGPFPADTLFHEGARTNYDAVLAMYHDQALIPLKTLDFKTGVNVTLGLPIVRTSPDHGTALDIAGKGLADPSSFIAALKLAGEIAARRTARTA